MTKESIRLPRTIANVVVLDNTLAIIDALLVEPAVAFVGSGMVC